MGYDSEFETDVAYGPSRRWWLLGFSWVLLAHSIFSLGLVPIHTATQLLNANVSQSEHLHWIGAVVVRNVLLCSLWYGAWHYALYVRRVAPHESKFNPEWNIGYCVGRDRLLALSGAIINSLFEVAQILLWSSGTVAYDTDGLFSRPLWNLFWASFAFYWSDIHFWFAHRLMHPWFGSKASWDPGAFLYRHVHSVHHKSYNPGPWSGLAMHPVEHLVYFTRSISIAFVPAALHPSIFLMLNLRAMLGPALGHHGFSGYLGYKFHYLHHAKFEVNYGTSCVVPIDNVLGTYSLGGVAQRWKPDRSLNAWMWLFGVPYLAPLACMVYVAQLLAV